MKKEKKKALLVAFVVSLVLLIVAVAATFLFDYYVESIAFDTLGLIGGHILGFILIFVIVYRYEIKDDSLEKTQEENHNIY